MDACAWQQALPLVVANSLHKKPQAISMLLCTSKAMADIVMHSCTGSLEVVCSLYDLTETKQMAAFLAKHASLLRTAALELQHDAKDRKIAEEVLAQALATASTSAAPQVTGEAAAVQSPKAARVKQDLQQQQHLPLQSFSSKPPSVLLLQELAASCSSSLTRLEVGWLISAHQGEVTAAAAAVSGLTAL